jgi:23S rRNA pseudouridine1911/1915/1917 synthase
MPEQRPSGEVRVRVSSEQDGATLAAVVRAALDDLPWSKSRDLVTSGRVTLAGDACFNHAQRVKQGAEVVIRPTAPRRSGPSLPESRIVHMDNEVIVVNKPAGVVTVPYDDRERDRDSLLVQTRATLRRQGDRAHGGDKREGLGVVQRLDKDTTGLLVFARTRRARKHLESQFRDHSITRRYLALAHGNAVATTHESDLMPDRGDGLRGSWRGHGAKPPKQARHAITHVKVEELLRDATLVACTLETGRQHQIRIHLAEAGNPLVGESVYIRGFRGTRIRAPRPMLHAITLGFRHPAHDRRMIFEAAIPDDFVEVLERLRRGP